MKCDKETILAVAQLLADSEKISLNRAYALARDLHFSTDPYWIQVLDYIPDSEVLGWLENERAQRRPVRALQRRLESRVAKRQGRARVRRLLAL
jgi:hypothetical protein